MRRIYLCFILFFFAEAELLAQTTLLGRVTDAKEQALAGAHVFILELQKGTVTDEKGSFHFNDLGKGIIRIQCSLLGYHTTVQTVDLSNIQGELIIKMERSINELEEVVVTSNNTSLAKNTPYSIKTVSVNDLRKTSQPTLVEMLSQQAGIDRISVGNGIGKPVIRGMSFNQILFYSMGTRIENQQWDDDHDMGISDIGIDRVEIVYGPAALIYGADALGGALIFVEEKPAPNEKILGDFNLGLFSNSDGINGDLGIKGTSKKGFFYITRFGIQSHKSYIQGKNGADHVSENPPYAPNSNFNNISGKGAIGLSRKWGVSKLSYSYLRSLTGVVEETDEDTSGAGGGFPEFEHTRNMQGLYQDVTIHIFSFENTFLTKASKWNVNTAYQVNDRKEFEPVLPGEPKYTAMGLLLHTFTYDVKWSSNENKKLGATIGTQGMMQTNKNYGLNIAVPDADVMDFGGYSLLRYDMNRWNFLAGLRFDARYINIKETIGQHEGEEALDSLEEEALNNSDIKHPDSVLQKYYYPVSFSIGTAYHPSENITIKANIATGFTAPNYAQLSTFGKHEDTYRFEVGNSDLVTEQNIEGDLTLIWELKDFSVDISAFYNHIYNYIYLAPTADSIHDLQVVEFEQHDARIGGGSAAINIHPRVTRWLDIKSTFSLTSGKLVNGGFLPYIPANKVITELKLQQEKIWKLLHPYFSITMDNYLSQNQVAQFETGTEGSTVFDARVATNFRVGKQLWSAGLFCTNIFDRAYFNHLSIIRDIGIYEMGRSFGIQLSAPLDIK